MVLATEHLLSRMFLAAKKAFPLEQIFAMHGVYDKH